MRFLVVILLVGVVHATATWTANPLTPIVNLLKDLKGKIQSQQETSEKDHKNYACWSWHSMKDAAHELCSNESEECAKDSLVKQRMEFMTQYQRENAKKASADNKVKAATNQINETTKSAEDELGRYQKATEDYNNNKARLERQKASLSNAQEIMCGAQTITNDDCKKESMKDDPCCKLLQGKNKGKAFLAVAVPKAERQFFSDLMEDSSDRQAFMQTGYSPASGKVQGMIDTMLNQSVKDLETALKDWESRTAVHEEFQEKARALIKTQTEIRNEALGDSAAAAAASADAQGNYDTADATFKKTVLFFDRVQEAWQTKRKEFVAAKEMRADELKAVSQGLEVLDSDDNRALMDASDKGTSFLQRGMMRLSPKEQTINRLMVLLSKRTGGFKVEKVMDDAIADLKKYKADLTDDRDLCVKTRHDHKMAIKEANHNNAKATSAADYAQTRIDKFTAEIEDATNKKAQANKEKDEATDEREQENADFTARQETDKKAIELLQMGREKIAGFYERALLQQKPLGLRKNEDIKVNKGEAASNNNAGNAVLMLIDQVIENTEADMQEDVSTESSEEEEFQKLKSALEDTISEMESRIASLDQKKAGQESEKGEQETTASTEEGVSNEETAALETLNTGDGNCDFTVNNFEYRQKRADSEIEGLRNAKATIQKAVHQSDADQ